MIIGNALDTRVECSSFAGDVLRQETAAVTTSISDDYANIDSNNNMGMTASSSFSSSTAIQDNESIPSSPIPTTSSATSPILSLKLCIILDNLDEIKKKY
ncbi:hypothetical protein PS15m_005795 [Mucor circinelloides]